VKLFRELTIFEEPLCRKPGKNETQTRFPTATRYSIKTAPRQARERHKDRVVSEREFKTLRSLGEEVAEFE
jgi:hypothetical protein